MKRTLLASTAVMGAGLLASPAVALDDIQLSGGRYFETMYMAGSGTDGGGNPESQLGAIGFGELRVGSDGGNTCIVAPGGTSNFSAFSPDPWAVDPLATGSFCAGIDANADGQALAYTMPVFTGFELTLSYTPTRDDHRMQGADPLTIAPGTSGGGSPDSALLYGSYSFEGEGWGLSAGAGASLEGLAGQQAGIAAGDQEFYQAGVNLTIGSFAAGGIFEYYKDLVDRGATDLDRWVAGAGIAYTLDAWTFGAQYAHVDQDDGDAAIAEAFEQDRISLTGNYQLGSGINIDGEIGYSWIEADPEPGAADTPAADGYDALEIGIGTNFTF